MSKFLGVYIDKNLSWREHIARVIRRVRQTVGIIGRARNFMNETQLLLLCNTMVLPHLQYCLLIWGNFAGDSNLKLRDEITCLQKSLVRIISNSGRISHADPLFARLCILKVSDLYCQALRVFSFKAFSGKLPGGVSPLFQRISHSYNTRGSSSNLYVSSNNVRSMLYLVPSQWNSLEGNLKSSGTISQFKSKSKSQLLEPYGMFVCAVPDCRSCAV